VLNAKELGERRLTVDSLKSKGKERELNTETQSSRRSETGTDLGIEMELAASGWCGASNGSVEGRGRADFNAEGTETAEFTERIEK
jgi:hypothetical protein